MKRLFLTLILLAGIMHTNSADASGSNTVFLSVRFNEYIFTSATQDNAFNNSTLYNYLESSESSNILVARVTPYVYRSTYYYTYWGYDASLQFSQYETITFRYYENLKAILGTTSKNDIVVLLPQIPMRPIPADADALKDKN